MNMFDQIKKNAFEDEMQKMGMKERTIAKTMLNALEKNIANSPERLKGLAVRDAVNVGNTVKKPLYEMTGDEPIKNIKGIFGNIKDPQRDNVKKAIKTIQNRKYFIKHPVMGALSNMITDGMRKGIGMKPQL